MALITELFTRTSPWVSVLTLLLFLVTGLFLGLRSARRRVERRTATSRRLGRDGEARAIRLLERGGYTVVASEQTARGIVRIDGVDQEYLVRCDALVERRGRRFVAEFKGGPEAARIETRATRRQLLEYAWVFDVDALLLVAADRGTIQLVEFP